MVKVNTVDKLIEVIKEKNAIVYGTGYVAERFIESLRMRGLESSIHCCVMTNKDKNSFYGYKVIGVNELPFLHAGELICIAVHESIKNEIVKLLEEKAITRYLWIYPFQHKLRFGEPIATNIDVKLTRIIETTKDDYRIAIRLAAINQFYGKNDCGYSIYIKGQELHCDAHTANKRLERFVELIRSWEINGYQNEYRPLVSEDYEILDGVHRVSLAMYYGMSSIPCDIYRAEFAKKYRNEFIDVTRNVLEKANLNKIEHIELERMEEVVKCLR